MRRRKAIKAKNLPTAVKTKDGVDPQSGSAAEVTGLMRDILGKLEGVEAELEAVKAKAEPGPSPAPPPPAPATAPTVIVRDGPPADGVYAKTADVDGIRERLDRIEANSAIPRAKASDDSELRSAIVDSPEWAKWKSGKFGTPGADSVRIPIQTDVRAKTTDPLNSTELGALAEDFYRPGIVIPQQEAIGFPNLIPRVPVGGAETYSFARETAKGRLGYVRSRLAAAVVSGAGATATFDSAEGFMLGETVRFYTAGGLETAVILSLVLSTGVVTFTATLNFNAAIDVDVTSERYGATAEEGDKPSGFLEFERATETIKTLAIMMGTTRQRLNNIAGLEAFIQGRMSWRQFRVLAWHLLYGDGTADELQGLTTATGVQTYTWSTDGTAGDTRVDAILDANDLLETPGDRIAVMNRRDWTAILQEKSSSDGHYLNSQRGLIGMLNTPTAKAIGDIAVVLDGALVQGDFMLMDPKNASELAQQGSAMASLGQINDDFRKNIVRVRYEEFVAHAVLDTFAYAYGQWDSAPA
jgi:hypothetical protein